MARKFLVTFVTFQPRHGIHPLVLKNRPGARRSGSENHSDEHALDFDSEVEGWKTRSRNPRAISDTLPPGSACNCRGHSPPFRARYIERCFSGWIELHGDRSSAMTRRCRAAWRSRHHAVSLSPTQKARHEGEWKRNFAARLLRLSQFASRFCGEKFGLPVIA